MLLGTVRKQFGIPAVASQHRWTRRAAVCGMPEFCGFSDFAGSNYRAGLQLGGEPKQGLLANLKPSDCIENKD